MTLVAAIATGLALLGLYLLTRSSATPPRPVTITEISPPPGTELARGDVAISPDGRLVAYRAQRGETTELYLRALDQVDAQPVDKGRGAIMPFFSPDGKWLGFYSLPEGLFNGKLMKVSVSGGAAVEIGEMDERPRGASWGPDETIVLNAGFGRGLSRVSAQGGEAALLASPDPERFEKEYRFPEILPGGEAVLFTVRPSDMESMDDAPIAALSLETGEHRVVLEGGTYARYSSSGHLVYARNGALLAVAFDLAELRVTGTPVTVLDGVSMEPLGGRAVFSLSRDGTLLYAPGDAHGTSNRLVWVDRQGRSQPLVDGHEFLQAHISPDGGRLVVQTDGVNFSLWVYDLRRRSMSRVAFGWDNGTPAWTPDGRQITFASNRGGGEFNLYRMAADGSGPAARLSPKRSLADCAILVSRRRGAGVR